MASKKLLLSVAAASAIAGIAVYMMKRNKAHKQRMIQKKAKRISKHLTDVFHNAKANAESKAASAL